MILDIAKECSIGTALILVRRM